MENVIVIEDWCVAVSDPYDPPEYCRLFGKLKGHPTANQDKDCSPSRFVSRNKSNTIFRGKSGKLYTLGEPKSDYEKAYPNSKERFLNSVISLPVDETIE